MLCRLTATTFPFKSNKSVGVHPAAFSYSLNELTVLVENIGKHKLFYEENQVYTRLLVLYFLDEYMGMPLGSIRITDSPKSVFNPKTFAKEIAHCKLLTTMPELRECQNLTLTHLPAKRMVDHLLGIVHTFLYATPYISFRNYLTELILKDSDIDDLVEYADTRSVQALYRLKKNMALLKGIPLGNGSIHDAKLASILEEVFKDETFDLDVLDINNVNLNSIEHNTGDNYVQDQNPKGVKYNTSPIKVKIQF
jgi:hypothetical protein